LIEANALPLSQTANHDDDDDDELMMMMYCRYQ